MGVWCKADEEYDTVCLPQRLRTTSSSDMLYIVQPLLVNHPPGKFNQEVD